MIECNNFEIEIEIEETKKRKLSWSFFTDLPCGTKVIISVERFYKDHDDSDCVWTLYNEGIEVTKTDNGDFNGNHGELVVDNADSVAFEDFNENLGPYSSGIKTPVTDSITVEVVVGARQPLKAFGKNNINMAGSQVVQSGNINVVRVSKNVSVPIKDKFQPLDFKRVK